MPKFYKEIPMGIDVVTAARQRIINIFSNKRPVILSFSGGKDSLCLNDLVFQLCVEGKIDKSLLEVWFIDEEAIYPCIERIVLNTRRKWLLIGVKFSWYAMEYKHFNCLNQLTQDETFVCFDSLKKGKWIRNPPPFAIRDDPLLIKGKDSYQSFSSKKLKGKIAIIGVRLSESVQRRTYFKGTCIENTGRAFPIYDWTDKDVWKYLYDNNIEFPDAYIYMYQCGVAINHLRISQFFSVDTVPSLVKMCEYYPQLFDKICQREPNAYLAMLYYDSEMFRRKKEKDESGKDEMDYKAECLKIIRNPEKYNIDKNKQDFKNIKHMVLTLNKFFDEGQWKQAYQGFIAGDPKSRIMRALYIAAGSNEKKKYKNRGRA